MHPTCRQRYIASMTSTLHKCIHCHTISIIYLCPRKADRGTIYEYDCQFCEGFNLFVPVKCIEQVGELPDRAVCAQPQPATQNARVKRGETASQCFESARVQ